ncbi:hypothetical protein SAMN06265348_11774 [Pedobacter westerhofensis]|uniref:Uncharacterized protein n=1 Tax=Pedobacter westerhofensis TaxID=425512 RepID=A0A521FRF5_9SPHI|nr:hypothetical protein SAMN06265348_11774 [Pedobacter westerhofensis]
MKVMKAVKLSCSGRGWCYISYRVGQRYVEARQMPAERWLKNEPEPGLTSL